MSTASDKDRPAPERFLALIREQQRGRLKVYLGFAATGLGYPAVYLLGGVSSLAALSLLPRRAPRRE